jgi:hypothetical protein
MSQPKKALVRVATATLSGEMLLDGQRFKFHASVAYPRVDAEFARVDDNSTPVDQWKALRALETFIDEHLRG